MLTPIERILFVVTVLVSLYFTYSPILTETGWHISWWLAMSLILAFLPYFP
jgi:hypothetical protein